MSPGRHHHPGNIRDRLIIGLDLSSVDEARNVVERIGDAGTFYKIGYQLGYAGGLAFAEELIGCGKKVFLDLKLHDIGNTVESGVRSVARLGATFLTVHAYPQTMRAAVAGKAGTNLGILAVTVMTSYADEDLVEAAYAPGITVASLVERRSAQARDLGIDGIVCAATEAASVRRIVGPNLAIVTPGIRPSGSSADDQKRILTPGDGIRSGADHLVVARPIIKAADPRAVTESIVEEIAAALA